MHLRLIGFFLAISHLCNAGEFRSWSNPDRTKTFEAEFVSRKDQQITLRLKDSKEITFSIDKLHQEDLVWLEENHSLTPKPEVVDENIDPLTIFTELELGDTRKIVAEKLARSKTFKASLGSTYFARTGLNGIYHSRDKIADLTCYLFFDWNDENELIEITLQTEDQSLESYQRAIKPCWEKLCQSIGKLYGQPRQALKIPVPSELEKDQMLASHLWSIENKGSLLLGTSRMDESYQAVVRLTKETFE